MNNSNLPNPSNDSGACGAENMKKIWLHHYHFLLNPSLGSPILAKQIDMYCNNIKFNDQFKGNVKEKQEIIQVMRTGNAVGYDYN